MLRKIVAPGIYQRGGGIRHQTGQYASLFGKTAYIIGGKKSLEVIEQDLVKSLAEAGMKIANISWYGGVVSWENVDTLAFDALKLKSDLIIGVGGGKAIDTAKAVAFKAKLPIVTIPTIAATCAPWTPLSIMYTKEGEFLELTLNAQNPSLVLVDSEIITQAPIELLRAGIGDTLAKWYELEITVRDNLRDATVACAYKLAHLCYETLIKYGAQAIEDSLARKVTEELEQIIDANILISGLVSGLGGDDFRSGGAHAVYNGFTVLKETHEYFHGSIVAFGILCQLILDKKEHEVLKLLPFYQETGLPYQLAHIGLTNLSDGDAYKVAKASVETEDMENLPIEVTVEMVVEAIRKVDELGKNLI
ncbi:MAG: iron-containing alcohol dehydrogenase family protein [Peptococcales bacterium]|jgi:glycerol dehydrogenase